MTDPRILCIGECMAELAPLDTAGDFRLGFAGDTFNTAWYLRQLRPDAPVSYLSAVGADGLSDRMLAFMQTAGIDTTHVIRHPDRSVGVYMISLSKGERSFSYWRDTSAARLLAEDDAALCAALDAANLVYFSGITLAILGETGRNRLLRRVREARAMGKTVAFDPNLRPGLWPDAERMKSAITEGASVSDVLLPSFEDEAMHFGDATPQATARRYHAAGASLVVVKNGPDPVYVWHGGQGGDVAIAPVPDVVDTTSAGDSFNAGFLSDWGLEIPCEDRVRHAASVAGQVVGGKGALIRLDRGILLGADKNALA